MEIPGKFSGIRASLAAAKGLSISNQSNLYGFTSDQVNDHNYNEIIELASPLWDNLIKCSNNKDYSGFTKDFSAQMFYGANEIELGKQWANNDLLVNLSSEKVCLGCLRRNEYVTVLYKQKSTKISGEFLGRLVLGIEDGLLKIFGATIF